MFPSRIIYQFGKTPKYGVIFLRPKKLVKFGYHLARSFGAGLIAFAVIGFIFSFYPIAKEEILYTLKLNNSQDISKFSEIISQSQAKVLGIDPFFSIYIPKIDAKAKIVPNVDAGSAKSYLAALKEGVAHAAGTNFPGQGKTIYLFSHSTDSPVNIARFNAVFYLLRKLEKGDRVVVYFMEKEYVYVVTDKFIAKPNDTSWLKDNGQGERLILQTCDPPGTSWNRLIVVARPVNK